MNRIVEYQRFSNYLESEIMQPKILVNNSFNVAVVGVSFSQDTIKRIFGNNQDKELSFYSQATLNLDSSNSHDSYAVKVEIDGEKIGFLSRKDARLFRSKIISGDYTDGIEVPAKITWDYSYEIMGSYGVRLNLDLTLKDSKPESPDVKYVSFISNQTDTLEFLVEGLNRFELSFCKIGDDVNLWVAEGTREVFIYRQGADFGEGKIGVCPEDVYKTIYFAPGYDAKIVNIYDNGCKISCRIISKAEMAERMKPFIEAEKQRRKALRKDITTPIKYSVIDSDIYRCFISNKSGMCSIIGTWDQFKIVEEHIEKLCNEKSGKYYKNKAKSAKFAIIFSPVARTYSNVSRLMESGYKVTTFEKALGYFGLSHLWDCNKLILHEYESKKSEYEMTFCKPFPLNKDEL